MLCPSCGSASVVVDFELDEGYDVRCEICGDEWFEEFEDDEESDDN